MQFLLSQVLSFLATLEVIFEESKLATHLQFSELLLSVLENENTLA